MLNTEISYHCVSFDDILLGELDAKDGISIFDKCQASPRDDDILDDLVVLVLDNGIQVSIVPKKYLPNGRSVVAS